MATVPQAEKWRPYSWWWDSHVSPKSCKWLQEDLTDMEAKIKLMIKIIEEEGDSFAVRAEMYYERRPELVRLVEEFYRAHRALAERYNDATRTLQRAIGSMSKGVHSCRSSPLMFPSASTDADLDFSTSRNLLQSHSFCGLDEREHVDSGHHPCHSLTPRNGVFIECDPFTRMRGLKQVNELFASLGGDTFSSKKSDQKGPTIQEQEAMKGSEFERCHGADKTKIQDEILKLQNYYTCTVDGVVNKQNVMGFSIEQHKEQDHEAFSDGSSDGMESASFKDQAHYRETEVGSDKQSLEKCILQLKEENSNLHLQVQHMQKKMKDLKASLRLHVLQAEADFNLSREQHCRLQEELEATAVERQKEIRTMKENEMKMKVLEENIQHAAEENSKLKGEVGRKGEEIEELLLCIEEELLHSMDVETKLLNADNLLARYKSEIELLVLRNQEMEEKIGKREREMQILQDETMRLKQMQVKLEHEMQECKGAKENVELENSFLSEKANNLELRLQDVIGKMDNLQVELQSLQENVDTKENHKSSVSYSSRTQEYEKGLYLKKLENMEEISDTNANFETVELKGHAGVCLCLDPKNSILISKKYALQEDLSNLLEKNQFLENCLSDRNYKLREMEGKLGSCEKQCCHLSEENFLLCNEKIALILQVGSFTTRLKTLEENYLELCNKQMSFEAEKNAAVCHLSELQALLRMEKQHNDSVVISTKTVVDDLHAQVSHLSDEIRKKQKELMDKEAELLSGATELFIFQICFSGLKEKILFLSKKHENLEEELRNRVMENDVLFQKVRVGEEMKHQNSELQCKLLVTAFELYWANAVRKETEEEMSWLTENLDCGKETLLVKETNGSLEEELQKVQRENRELITKEDKLASDLLHEASCHEKVLAMHFEERNLAVVCSMMFEEKARQLMGMHENLKMKYMEYAKAVNDEKASNQELSRKCDVKEEENKQLKNELEECQSLVSSLKDCFSYLEDSIRSPRESQMINMHEGSVEQKCGIDPQTLMAPKVSTELQKLIMRLDGIQKDVIEAKLCDSVSTFIYHPMHRSYKVEKEIHEISSKDYNQKRIANCRDEAIPKDIQLDYSTWISRYKDSSTVTDKLHRNVDDQVIEKRQTEKKRHDCGELVSAKPHVSKQEPCPQKFCRDVVELLLIDSERLTTLRTTMLELNQKAETIERSKPTNNLEFDGAKQQLKYMENSIHRLIGKNMKLMKRANDHSSQSDIVDIPVLEKQHSKHKVMESVVRESQKIGEMELRMRKLQCTFLELTEGMERLKIRTARKGSRVVLGDFLFGKPERNKVQKFCGCVETRGRCYVKKSVLERTS